MGFGKLKLRSGPWKTPEIDLLSTAFNLPTRRDVKRAEKKRAASHKVVVQRDGVRYELNQDGSSEDETNDEYEVDDETEGEDSQDEESESEDEADTEPLLRQTSSCRSSSRQPASRQRPHRQPSPLPPVKVRQDRSTSAKTQQPGVESPPVKKKPFKPVKTAIQPEVSIRPAVVKEHRQSRGKDKEKKARVASRMPTSATFPFMSGAFPDSQTGSDPSDSSVASEPIYSHPPTSQPPMWTAPPTHHPVQYPVQHPAQYFYQPQAQFAYPPAQTVPQQPQYMAHHFAPASTVLPQPLPQTLSHPMAMPLSGYYPQPYPPPNDLQPPDEQPVSSQRSKTLKMEIDRIQDDMNRKHELLAEKPGDAALEADLRNLQHQLNSTLDAAMPGSGVRVNGAPPVLPGAAASPRAKSPNGPGAESKPVKQSKSAQEDPKDSETDHVVHQDEKSKKTPSKKKKKDQLSEPSPPPADEPAQIRVGHGIRHHLCSACGEVRSERYHDKHPFIFGRRIENYCGDCMSKKILKGSMENHCCFLCGRVRSRKYQEAHPASRSDSLHINYCLVCTNDHDDADSIPDDSTVGVVCSKPSGIMIGADLGQSLGSSRVAERHLSPIQEDNGSSVSGSQHNESASLSKLTAVPSPHITIRKKSEPELHQRRSYRRSSIDKNLEPLSFDSLSDTNKSDGAAPYFPERDFGSAHRRSQRSSPVKPDPSTGFQTFSSQRSYQAPYVEDALNSARSQPDHETPRGGPWFGSQAGGTYPTTRKETPTSSKQTGQPSIPKRKEHQDGDSSPINGRANDDSEAISNGSFESKSSKGSKSVRWTTHVEVHKSGSPDSFHDEMKPEAPAQTGTDRKSTSTKSHSSGTTTNPYSSFGSGASGIGMPSWEIRPDPVHDGEYTTQWQGEPGLESNAVPGDMFRETDMDNRSDRYWTGEHVYPASDPPIDDGYPRSMFDRNPNTTSWRDVTNEPPPERASSPKTSFRESAFRDWETNRGFKPQWSGTSRSNPVSPRDQENAGNP